MVVHGMICYHGSDMGFSKDGWEIASIFDRHGNRLEPIFSAGTWTEIAPGVATSNPAYKKAAGSYEEVCKEAISISSAASPLKVILRAFRAYNDYDKSLHVQFKGHQYDVCGGGRGG